MRAHTCAHKAKHTVSRAGKVLGHSRGLVPTRTLLSVPVPVRVLVAVAEVVATMVTMGVAVVASGALSSTAGHKGGGELLKGEDEE